MFRYTFGSDNWLVCFAANIKNLSCSNFCGHTRWYFNAEYKSNIFKVTVGGFCKIIWIKFRGGGGQLEEPTHQLTRGAELLFFYVRPLPTATAQHETNSGSTYCFHWAGNTDRHLDLEPAVSLQWQLQRHLVRSLWSWRNYGGLSFVDTHVLATEEPPVQLILAWIASSFSGATVLRADDRPCILYLSQYLYLGTMRSELFLFNCNTECVIVNMSWLKMIWINYYFKIS